ncbi:MAG: Gfo/Idh/MocA family oxidoreductase [Chthonomonadales bacterium]
MDRRDFLKGLTLTSIGMGLTGAEELAAHAQAAPQTPTFDDELKGRQVNCAVIGMGARGKEIVSGLSKMTDKFVKVSYICDTFAAPAFVKRAQVIAPDAKFEQDYKKVLADKAVEAVFIATPTHKHRQIALEAIAAGKHVYLEAPIAHTVDDAKAIAQAAQSSTTVFQAGLQYRCNAQALHVRDFMDSAAIGKPAGGRAQFHERKSWRLDWPTPERASELNWRLDKNISTGLAGEVGIHQIDCANWYFKQLPTAISGFSHIAEYNDGRTVPDTVQLVLEYPNGVHFLYDATLTNSFDGQYELYYGSESAVMLRDLRAWMFREGDAPLLGWEVFARKDPMSIGSVENKTGLLIGAGIALVANATKQLALGKEPGKVGTDTSKSALYLSTRQFLSSVRTGKRSWAKEPSKDHPSPPLVPGPKEGYIATVIAIKANEAVMSGTRVVLDKELFNI